MQLALILAVLAALGIAESAPSEPVSGAGVRLAIAGCGMMLVAGFALAVSGLVSHGLRIDSSSRRMLLRRLRRLRAVHAVLWLATAGGIFYWLDWPQLVHGNWGLGQTILLDEILILIPVLLPLILSWTAFYGVDRAAWLAASGAGPVCEPFSTRWQYVALHVRHHLGLLMLPVLALLAVEDVIELTAPEILRSGRANWVFLPAVAGLVLAFPILLRHVWRTRPLPAGPLRERLEAAARESDFSARDIMIWDTDGMVVNAAVAGLTSRLRYVFLTDALLGSLSGDEIEAIFRHEMGHVRHHHLLLRMVALMVPISLWLLLEQACPGVAAAATQWLASDNPAVQVQIAALFGLGIVGYAIFVFGFYSRLLEHQADLFAYRRQALGICPSGEAGPLAADSFVRAMEKLGAGSTGGRSRRSWLHGSIAQRIDFVQQIGLSRKRKLRFQRQLRGMGGLLIGLSASPVVWKILFG